VPPEALRGDDHHASPEGAERVAEIARVEAVARGAPHNCRVAAMVSSLRVELIGHGAGRRPIYDREQIERGVAQQNSVEQSKAGSSSFKTRSAPRWRFTQAPSGARHRLDQARLTVLLVEFAAQAADMGLDDSGVRVEMEIPNTLKHHRPCDDLPRVAHQIFEQAKLAWLQLDQAIAAADGAARQVHL
jgi:hypothetical protein